MGCSYAKEQEQHSQELMKLLQHNGGRQVSGKEIIIYEAPSVFHGKGNLLVKAAEEKLPPSYPILLPPAPLLPLQNLYPLPSVPAEKRVEPVVESSLEGCVASRIREVWHTGQIDTTEEWGVALLACLL